MSYSGNKAMKEEKETANPYKRCRFQTNALYMFVRLKVYAQCILMRNVKCKQNVFVYN